MLGLSPFATSPQDDGLTPALRFTSYVADVKLLQSGESAGYGRRFIATEPTWIGLVPAGYADGVPRILSGQADVLVRGRRRRVAATISMDQLTFVIGPECDVELGDAGHPDRPRRVRSGDGRGVGAARRHDQLRGRHRPGTATLARRPCLYRRLSSHASGRRRRCRGRGWWEVPCAIFCSAGLSPTSIWWSMPMPVRSRGSSPAPWVGRPFRSQSGTAPGGSAPTRPRSTSPAAADRFSTTWPSATSRSTRWRFRWTAASWSIRSAVAPTSKPEFCGLSPRACSTTIRCGCCVSPGSLTSSISRLTRTRPKRAQARAGAGGRPRG